MRWKQVQSLSALALFILLFAVLVYAASVSYNSQVDFDSGQYNATNFTNGVLQPIDFSYVSAVSGSILEENQSEDGSINMSGNYLLVRLNETTADTLAGSEDFEDLSGQGYHGEDYGTVGYASTGVFDEAIDLTSNGAIDFGDIEMSSWTGLTISVWINRTGGTGSQRIVSKDRQGQSGNFILRFNDNTLELYMRDGGSWRLASYNPTSGAIDGEWHHIVGTVDTVDNEVLLYFDGVLVDTLVYNSASITDSSNEEVVLGADSRVGSFSQYFTGYVDELAIWDRELSSEEILVINTSASGEILATEFLYESAVEDAGSSIDWQSFAFFQEYCYECPLPDFSQNETSSEFNRTIDMDQTIFLYHFDESVMNSTADNQDFYDSSGNYFHANESDGVLLANESGVFGGAVNFSGSEEIIVGEMDYSSLDTISMGAWFQTTSSSGAKRIISSDEEGVFGNFVFYVYDNKIRTIFRNGASSWYDLMGSTDVSDGEWHHGVVVADSINDMIYLYLDGELVDSLAYTHDPLNFPSTKITVIGADSDEGTYTQNFDGLLDEVFMLGQALTADEIRAMYFRGASNPYNFQIQSCNDAACSGESYTSFSGNSPIDISSLTDNQYVQLFVNMDRFDNNGSYGPWLYNFTLTDDSLEDLDVQPNGTAWLCSSGCRDPSEDPGAGVPAVIELDTVVNATSGTDRRYELIWNNSAIENVTYDLQVSTIEDFSSTIISETGLTETNASQTMYNISNDLDVDDIYYWRVRALNGITEGAWSETWQFEVLSYLAISLPTNSVEFGTLYPLESKDTQTTSGLQPIVVVNDGNYLVNVTVNASSFFVNPGGLFQFKVEENETSSYESAFDSSWVNLNTSLQQAVTRMHYENSTNTANMVNLHLLVSVPSQEPAAAKTSFIEINVE